MSAAAAGLLAAAAWPAARADQPATQPTSGELSLEERMARRRLAEAGPPTTAPTTAPAPLHRVHLEQPMVVGQRYLWTRARDVIVRSTGAGGGAAARVSWTAAAVEHLLEVQVLAVNPRGRPTKVECRVVTFRARLAEKVADLFPADAVVSVEWTDGGPRYAMKDGSAVPALAASVLDGCGLLDDPGRPDADEIFGTRTWRHVGDVWSVEADNARAMAAAAAKPRLVPAAAAGRATLRSATSNDAPAQEVELDWSADGLTGRAPDGTQVIGGSMRQRVTRRATYDPDLSRFMTKRSLPRITVESVGEQRLETLSEPRDGQPERATLTFTVIDRHSISPIPGR